MDFLIYKISKRIWW